MSTQSNKLTLLKLLGAALLLLGVIGRPQSADARLDPFFIVNGPSYGAVTPRILFMLDTSGSMGMDLTYDPKLTFPATKCYWDNCEDETKGMLQSRIHAARNVISTIAHSNQDGAQFALMTYAIALPPDGTAGRPTPTPCTATATVAPLVKDKTYRFTWSKNVNQPFSSQWKPNRNPFGVQGSWILCGDNRPFPYLRYDNLGFAMADNSQEALLDQPLYKTKSDLATFQAAANYSRKVQWFPRWVGRRARLDCNNAIQSAIADATYGDYDGANLAAKRSAVCAHDFYYWPYVDGNPGYSFYKGLSENAMSHMECDDNGNNCAVSTAQDHRLGIARRQPGSKASLYAPFYSPATMADGTIPTAGKGPMDLTDAWLMFDGITAKMYAGGADVLGGTPTATSLGVPENYVNLVNGKPVSKKVALPWTNSVFGHDTVSSYLAFLRLVDKNELCSPISLIMVTDGQPDPWASEGGSKLYDRLRSVRRVLGVKTYIVAYTQEVVLDGSAAKQQVHEMGCAASGADSSVTPCTGGNTFANWDTCANPEDPVNACAWITSDATELQAALSKIITQDLSLDVPTGTPTVANDFQKSDPNDPESKNVAVQTSITSYTDYPEWTGHVVRAACDDEDPDNPGQLTEYCKNVGIIPMNTEEVESFGPCPLGRVWDAGECLQQTQWNERRIFTHDYANKVFRIADDNGNPTTDFINLVNLLNNQGKLSPALAIDGPTKTLQIDAMAKWLLGKGLPDDWKLPGLPNAAPILIRRVPQYNANFLPTVGIRDPHCAGRRNTLSDNIPPTLEAFATDAWSLSSGNGFDTHYEYEEAVLVGDDFGMLHAFHYDSGNELFGFVPLALLNNARKLSNNGTASYGQPAKLTEHIYGLASTINNGFVYDDFVGEWRHMGVFGLGPGGSEIIAVDLSHMGRLGTDDPIEVLWTTSTAPNAADYAATLGQTWSRPAITYAAPNDSMSLEPKAYVVFGSGYRNGVGAADRGRFVWTVDALTGHTVTQRAFLTPPDSKTTYDALADYSAISDIAVGSHCLSRYWGEMEEAYWADPAGRLYRWDLAAETSNVSSFPHAADGGGAIWPLDPGGFAVATESARFAACQSTDDYSCSVGSIGGGAKGDVFTYSPAVVSNNRIDELNDNGGVLPIGDRDQFMIALASGSPNDNVLSAKDTTNDFHSSIYLIADDHRQDHHNGFDIAPNGPLSPPGTSSKFMRMALNQIERTRTIHFPDNITDTETRNFSQYARPLRSPIVRVTGVLNGEDQVGEAFYITYTIYEPGTKVCDQRWFNDQTGEWDPDPGATYDITFRIVVEKGQTFDFNSGYTLAGNYGDGFGTKGGLVGPVVTQVECGDGNCGAMLKAPKTTPCDPNNNAPPTGGAISVSTSWSEVEGFTPLELDL